jgi:CBS domain containing-hemolysin-like protein
MHIFLLIIVSFVLVLLNGFFVAAEFATVKLRGTRLEAIKTEHGISGRVLTTIHRHLDGYLSACQLGITLASLGLGWIGEPAFARLFEAIFQNTVLINAFSTFLSFIVAFLIISFLHIVVGELAPKSLAIRKVEKVALMTALPLYGFYWAMYPIIWLLNSSANVILRLIGVGEAQKENIYSIKELKLILNASHMHEDLSKNELQILDRVLDFTNLTVGDLMRPLHEMKAIYVGQPIDQIIKSIASFHLSRYPIYAGMDKDDIIGVLHVKDLLDYVLQKRALPSLEKLKRPIIEADLASPAIDLFHQFRAGAGHLAMVKNDMGKCVGFITLDDILSVALGSISDEFVKPHRDWFLTKDNKYVMYGYTPLYTLERLLRIELQDQESNTVSGLLLSKLQRMPVHDEIISFPSFDVQVLKVKGPRIELVKVIPTK